MFDTWSRRLLAGQSRPPCDKCMGQATVPLLVHQMCLENHDEQIRRRDLINPGACFLAHSSSLNRVTEYDPSHPIASITSMISRNVFYIFFGKKRLKKGNTFFNELNVESNIILKLTIDNRKIDYKRLNNWFGWSLAIAVPSCSATPSLIVFLSCWEVCSQ